MKYLIPGKTFLAGEYIALTGGPALVLLTEPGFAFAVTDSDDNSNNFHPASPAYQYLKQNNFTGNINFNDPFNGIGGLGASSAQFIGSYLACNQIKKPKLSEVYDAYITTISRSETLGSGYDVLAQGLNQIVYICKKSNIVEVMPWSFSELDFLLIHTGNKLNTHEHLTKFSGQNALFIALYDIVDNLRDAFLQANSEKFINNINVFADKLIDLSLVTAKTMESLSTIKAIPEVIAAKGCGALGSDIILVIYAKSQKNVVIQKLKMLKKNIIHTSLYQRDVLFENNFHQSLEILA